MKTFRICSRLCCLLLAASLLCGVCSAADVRVRSTEAYALSKSDFFESGDGILVSSVPSDAVCRICCGSRVLRPGDVIAADLLQSLTVTPVCDVKLDCDMVYKPIADHTLLSAKTLSFSLIGSKNTAPSASDSELETYKNVANSGTLRVTDAEGGVLSYQLVKAPRRGSVELHDDGSFIYTPKHNKVGRDSFTFTATDEAGQVSEPATVTVRIVKPTDRAVYSDLHDRPDEYPAMWLKEVGAFSGEKIGGALIFDAEKTVARGEFLTMAMTVFDRKAEAQTLSAGFSDEPSTPEWMQPYILTAFSEGVIGGSAEEDGLFFRPTAAISGIEAALMVQKLLELPDAQPVFADDGDAVPVWARGAVSALSQRGIAVSSGELTRMDAAKLLYAASML